MSHRCVERVVDGSSVEVSIGCRSRAQFVMLRILYVLRPVIVMYGHIIYPVNMRDHWLQRAVVSNLSWL